MRARGGGLGDFLRSERALQGEKAGKIGGDGVGDVDDGLAAQGIPVIVITAAALAYGTARMTMSPAGAAPVVPTVAPPSVAATSSALTGLRPMISTALPPASARPARALAMLPAPMMLMLLLMTHPV